MQKLRFFITTMNLVSSIALGRWSVQECLFHVMYTDSFICTLPSGYGAMRSPIDVNEMIRIMGHPANCFTHHKLVDCWDLLGFMGDFIFL